MKSYYDYLEESTNVVKSNTNRNKIVTILSYLLIWACAMIVFWFFTSGSDAMGYSLMFLWFILPVTTFIVSVVIGKNNFWGKGKWAFTLFFGVIDYSLVIAPVVADLCTTPVALSAPPNSYQNNSQS